MYFIRLLFQLSIFLLGIKLSYQQFKMSALAKKQFLDELKDPRSGNSITGDPYDDEDKSNPTNIEEILNIDAGRYTTILFNYHNHQNTYPTVNYAKETNDTCIDSYIACLLSSTTRTFVCTTNDLTKILHTVTYMTHCDMYFDNCRRGYRVWRVISQGYCFWLSNGAKRIYKSPTDVDLGPSWVK